MKKGITKNNNEKGEALQTYLRYMELEQGYSQHTIKLYTRSISDFLQSIKISDISKIKSDHLIDYRQSLEGKKESYKTKNLRLIPVRRFLAFLKKKNITELTGVFMEPFRNRNGQTKMELPPVEAVKKFIAPQGPEYLDVFLAVAYTTGMRLAEIMALRVGDVQEQFSIMGKGSKQRFIPCPLSTVSFVRAYEEKSSLKKGDKLFPVTYRTMQRLVQERAIRNKLDISSHTLRHCYATFLLSQGVDIRTVQELLGHASLVTTQIYTHVTNDQLRDAVKKAFSNKY